MDDFRISLKAARVNANVSQKTAAEALGINPATLRGYEDGRYSIKAEALIKLCDLYHISRDRIFLPIHYAES